MSSELIKTNAGYIVPNMSNDDTSGIMEELNGLNISLDKIKIPAGGGLAFEVPGEDPDFPDSEKEIIGVIVDHYPLNSFWTEKYNGQNVAPNCYSTDNRIGIGTPCGECAKCPSQQIPEDLLKRVVGDTEFCEIHIPCRNTINIVLNDGTVITKHWENPSRKESWTPQMREMARERSKNG